MVTDRKIIISNGNISQEITKDPFYVSKMDGFDSLETVIVTSQGFDQDGAALLNSYVLPRDISVSGQIKADTAIQMQGLHDKLLTLFAPKRSITINHYYGGKNRIINAMVEKTPKIEFTEVSTIHEYTVQMKATEPYWKDDSETLVQIANWNGCFHFPLSIPITGVIFGVKSAALIVNVYNKSAIKVGMRFDFIANGQVKNPQLFNVNTREFFKLRCTMEAGEQITIVTGEDKIVQRKAAGITQNYIGKIDLAGGGNTFLELDPGDNLFRYAADSGEDMLEVKIYFNNKYLGV